MKKTVIGIIVLIVIAGAVFLAVKPDADETPGANESPTSNQTSNEDSQADETTSEEAESTVTIVYTDIGFEPDSYKIKAGGTVTVVNNSSQELDFASDDHPVHSDNSEYNLGMVEPGQSSEFTVEKTGQWGFHNHSMDAHSGTITVE